MKIVSLNSIYKSILALNASTVSGLNSLFGRGTFGSKVVSRQDYNGLPLTSWFGPESNYSEYQLDFQNLTIEEGVDIQATDKDSVFYLKVNGTLTVNGHLHMDNMGGSTPELDESITPYTSDGIPVYRVKNTYNLLGKKELDSVSDDTSCKDLLFSDLSTYGALETFLKGNTALTGSGGVGYRYKGETLVGVESVSALNGGGKLSLLDKPSTGGFICGGGGGGFIALYYENMINYSTKRFNDNIGSYPLNIHANGGSSTSNLFNIRGGGCMIIAARNIVIGENGSITCDGGDGNGLMSLLSRAPYNELYMYNGGNPIKYNNQFTGGAGYAMGFDR